MEQVTTSKMNTAFKLFLVFVFISLLFVYLTAYTKYIWAKDYYFIVETPCETNKTTCFVRDCDEYCPPNELEIYSSFLIKAYNYEECGVDCTKFCTEEATRDKCEIILCDPEVDNCSE